MTNKKIIGDFGQDLAVKFLLKRGYHILEQNFFCREGEIDIVVKDDDQLVFVEVKTRLTLSYGLPEDSFDVRKKNKLEQSALAYLEKNNLNTDDYRFDCLAVEIDKINKRAKIRHYKAV